MSAPVRARTPVTPELREIQAPVADRLEAVSQTIGEIITADNPLMNSVNGHLLQMRGKMFRPTLLLLCSAVEERPDERAITLAASVEIIHLATLVHDDSIDHSAMRRGLPTINSMFSHQVSVIMGDFLYSRALATLVRRDEFEALRVLTDSSIEMTVGEMRQMAATDTLAFDEVDYEELIHAKTASLFRAACYVGALCGAREHREALGRFGERLGMAFQVADDLLDYTGAEKVTGKPVGLDLREHKVTLPLIHTLPRLKALERRRVEALFATENPDDGEIGDVIDMVERYGGLDYARQRGDAYAQEAEEALASLPASAAKQSLLDAIDYVMSRRA